MSGVLLSLAILWSGWTYQSIGDNLSGAAIRGVAVGDGRNDGVMRVYAGGDDQILYEFSFINGNWVKTVIDLTSTPVHGICIGDGRNDGTNRIYVPADDDTSSGGFIPIYEYTWTGSGWIKTPFVRWGRGAPFQPRLAAMRPNIDSHLRLYTACNGRGGEYMWQDNLWVQYSTLPDPPDHDSYYHDMWIGPGRNDEVLREYQVSASGNIYEFTPVDSTSWSMGIIGTNDRQSYAICVADGRNDAVQRVYAGGSSDVADTATLYEYTFDQGSWTRRQVDRPPGESVLGMTVGPGRGDDSVRIYAGCVNEGSLYEYTWTGSEWLRGVCGSPARDGYHDIVIAPGRNDDSLRLYVGGLNGSVYEFTYRADAVIRVEPDSAIATDPAVTAIYDLYVINLGLRDDVIDIEITNTLPGWSARLTDINGNSLTDTDGDNTPDVGSVRRKDSVELRLMIVSPQDAQPGTVDSTRVWGLSTNVPGVADSSLLQTSILEDTTTTPTTPPPDIHNFPNPFEETTTFIYSIPSEGEATLSIYNRAGEHMATLFADEPHSPGIFTCFWDGCSTDGKTVAPGVYIYVLTFVPDEDKNQTIVKKALKMQ